MFAVFVLLAAFIKPDMGVSDQVTPGVAAEMEALRQAVWWTTIAMVMLPIMMMLITLAMYLFITGNPSGALASKAAPAAKKGGLFGIGSSKSKKVETTSTTDVLDLRYARGEITREQYLAMKADLAAAQGRQLQL